MVVAFCCPYYKHFIKDLCILFSWQSVCSHQEHHLTGFLPSWQQHFQALLCLCPRYTSLLLHMDFMISHNKTVLVALISTIAFFKVTLNKIISMEN